MKYYRLTVNTIGGDRWEIFCNQNELANFFNYTSSKFIKIKDVRGFANGFNVDHLISYVYYEVDLTEPALQNYKTGDDDERI